MSWTPRRCVPTCNRLTCPPSAVRDRAYSVMSLREARADSDQRREPVHRLVRGPADAAEGEDAEQGVVEGPREVAGDADEDAAFSLVARPHQRARGIFLRAAGEK